MDDILVFVKVVDEKSFSGAGRALGLPRSTVSRQVARLEDHLGVRLLHRTTRRQALTDAGAAYYARVAPLVEALGEAEDAIRRRSEAPRGTLRVSGPLSFGERVLGDVAAAYLERYPEVRLELVLEDRMVDLVGEGFDLAIRVGRLRDSSLMARKLGSTEVVLCASPEYLALRGTPERPEDLRHHDCLLYSHERASAATWTFGDVGVVVRGPMTSNNGDILCQAAMQGRGIAAQPRFIAGPWLESGALVQILEDQPTPLGGIWAVWPQSRHLSPALRAFVDLVAEVL